MPSLKELRSRVNSIRSTQKITKAMQMVAASKLRKVKDAAELVSPYAQEMHKMVASVLTSNHDLELSNLTKKPEDPSSFLVILVTSDKGLCGAFNQALIRKAKHYINSLKTQNKNVKIICVGKKGYEQLSWIYKEDVIKYYENLVTKDVPYSEVVSIKNYLLQLFDKGDFELCQIFYNKFENTIKQTPLSRQLIPASYEDIDVQLHENDDFIEYIYEPEKSLLLDKLININIAVQIYSILLESAAGEQAARMMAMDNATKNADQMISRLTLELNRTRQYLITKELVEIISGAEVL